MLVPSCGEIVSAFNLIPVLTEVLLATIFIIPTWPATLIFPIFPTFIIPALPAAAVAAAAAANMASLLFFRFLGLCFLGAGPPAASPPPPPALLERACLEPAAPAVEVVVERSL